MAKRGHRKRKNRARRRGGGQVNGAPMKICQPHWDELRRAIRDRGLEQYVSKDGADAAARLVRSMEEKQSKANFDPLMAAHTAILSNALRIGGLYILAPAEGGGLRCPICHLKRPEWIDYAANDQLMTARELGLVPTA